MRAEQGYARLRTNWRVTNLVASRYWPARGFALSHIRLVRRVPGSVIRVPLLSGTRLVVASRAGRRRRAAPAGARRAAVADIAAAVRDALRFPLEGDGIEALVAPRRRGRRSSSSRRRCRFPARRTIRAQHAIAAVVDELERLGISTGYQTFLVAAGLARRTSQRELESLVTPELARRFHGHVVVHDVEDPELVAARRRVAAAAAREPRARRDGSRRSS